MHTLILSCSTGQGHNSCAGAIADYFRTQGADCEIQDALGFVSGEVSDFICWGHTVMYRHIHGLFQFGYRFSEKHGNMFEDKSALCRLLARGTEPLQNYIVSHHIDNVICTHVFASLMVTQMQARYALPLATGLVATDYTCNPGTRESIMDRYFIPASPLSVYYACPRIPEERMISCGIPIRQMFYTRTPREKAKAVFHIPVTHRHLVMMCGSMGCGPMKALARHLTASLSKNTDLSIVCGTNRKLQQQLVQTYARNSSVHVLGYVRNVSALMDSADLYLTKPGGISVTEAAMKNLPMVFVDAVAGCEAYNRIYFIEKGAAVTGATVREITAACVDLLENPEKLERMRAALSAIPKINAPAVIYRETAHLLENNAYETAKA